MENYRSSNEISVVTHFAICWWEGKPQERVLGNVNDCRDRTAALLTEEVQRFVNEFNCVQKLIA